MGETASPPTAQEARAPRRDRKSVRPAPVILVFGCKPERLLDTEQRIDAFLDAPTQEQAPTLVDAIASGLGEGASVIVLVPEWLPDDVMVRLDMARTIVDTSRVAVHRTPLPPLAAAVLASVASACGPHLPSAGLLASLLGDLEAELHVITWLGSVARLTSPQPSMAQHVASLAPGAAFGVSSWPEPAVHRIVAGEPSVPLPTLARPSRLVVAPAGGNVEWITQAVNGALGGLPVRTVDPTPHGAKWWGTGKLVEAVVYPADAAALAGELMAGVEPWACRWCSELIARSPCPMCGHRARPVRRRPRAREEGES
jgi:hypothetical protein